MANRVKLDTMGEETCLRPEESAVDGARLALVTRGEALARLLADAMACRFSQEVPERGEERETVEGFLRDCVEFSDVHGLPAALHDEMGVYFGERLDALWRLGWLVFGGAHEAPLEPGEHPLRGRVVTLSLVRYDSPSVEMDARLRRSVDTFKAAMARVAAPAAAVPALVH